MKQSETGENEDMGHGMRNGQPFTAFLFMWVRRDGGLKVKRKEREGEREKERVKVVINLMEKSNTNQIHSSKLDALVVLFLARAKP